MDGEKVPKQFCVSGIVSLPFVQRVPLQACLDLPTVSLSTDTIDFGFCYVARTKTVEVDLHSQGTYIYWTSVIGEYYIQDSQFVLGQT